MIQDIKAAVTEKGLLLTAKLPGLQSGQFEITVEGRSLRLVSSQRDGCGPFDSLIDLPPGFNLAQANAAYLKGQLRIVIPPLTVQRIPGPSPFSGN